MQEDSASESAFDTNRTGFLMPSFRCCLAVASLAVLCALRTPDTHAADTQPPAQVMIVGTWHFTNPGQDIHNMESDDMLSVPRQQQIYAASKGLEGFEPNVVAVEWPDDVVAESYVAYRKRELPVEALRNEVVQLGFRMAAHRELDKVHGIDMPGEFPMDAVGAWANANGRGEAFGALMAQAGAMVEASTQMLGTQTVGDVLRHLNEPAQIEAGQALYLELLRYGAGDEQPGAELNAAWQRRNYRICARLLQILKPGDRAVVYFGQGHAHALRRCVIEAPGVDLVEANDWLPK